MPHEQLTGLHALKIREMVTIGSTMTRSPVLSTRIRRTLHGFCSAIKGEMFDLKNPVPIPLMTMPTCAPLAACAYAHGDKSTYC